MDNSKYQLEKTTCPICSSPQHTPYMTQIRENYNQLDGLFDIVECTDCGMRYVNPRPTMDTISYFYPDSAGYYKKPIIRKLKNKFRCTLVKNFKYSIECKKVTGYFFVKKRFINLLKQKHFPDFVPEGKILDVGCASGSFLLKMKQLGWEVFGQEMNTTCVDTANEILGANCIKQGIAEKLDYPDNSFDVVNMSMVLEHTYNPVKAVKEVKRVLKPEGQFICSVPDINGIETKIFKKNAYCIQVPQHLNHFSVDIIRKLLLSNGFDDVKIYHNPSMTDMTKPACYIDKKWLHIFVNNGIARFFMKRFINFMSKLGKTSRMVIFSRKLY